jgi:hypothetical protein
VNDVTLKEGLKIANRKFHDLFQFCRGIHGKIFTLPTNERIPAAEGLPNLFVRGNFGEITGHTPEVAGVPG